MVYLKEVCVLLITATLFSTCSNSPDVNQNRDVRSNLILEYNWPKAIKGLKRFPHVVSCFHFYATSPDGKSHVIKKCPDGQAFDFATLRCVEERLAKCWSAQFKKDRNKTNEFTCPFLWGPYPDVEDCSNFYSCLNGKARLRKCPDSSLFDKAARKCVKASKALCADETDTIDPGYQCPYAWGYFTYPRNCSKFYECLQKNPSVRSCKKDMLFDNRIRRCLPKNQVKCGARFNPYGNFDETSSAKFDMSTVLPTSELRSKMPVEGSTAAEIIETEKESLNSTAKQSIPTDQTRFHTIDGTAFRTDGIISKSVTEIITKTESANTASKTASFVDETVASRSSYPIASEFIETDKDSLNSTTKQSAPTNQTRFHTIDDTTFRTEGLVSKSVTEITTQTESANTASKTASSVDETVASRSSYPIASEFIETDKDYLNSTAKQSAPTNQTRFHTIDDTTFRTEGLVSKSVTEITTKIESANIASKTGSSADETTTSRSDYSIGFESIETKNDSLNSIAKQSAPADQRRLRTIDGTPVQTNGFVSKRVAELNTITRSENTASKTGSPTDKHQDQVIS